MVNKDMKVIDLAAATGLSRITISNIKNGKSCTHETANKIAAALDVDINKLLLNE